MVGNDDEIDQAGLRLRAAEWLFENCGIRSTSRLMAPVPPQIMVEKTVTTENGDRPDERRLFIFDGIAGCAVA